LAWLEGQRVEAFQLLDEFLSGARARQDFQGVSIALCHLAQFKLELGLPDEAEAPAREGLAAARFGWQGLLGQALGPLGEALAKLGAADAEAPLAELDALADKFGLGIARPQLLRARALLYARAGALPEAIEVLLSGAALARSQHAAVDLAQTLVVLASTARRLGEVEVAKRADAERLEIVRRIGPEAYDLEWAQALPLGDDRQHATQPDDVVSARQREVVMLIVRGFSNRQIAQELVISERTVENHVSAVLAKLGLDTRSQVAIWAVQHGLAAPDS
jgi:DNA-binding NarL/FixJ family response regulator